MTTILKAVNYKGLNLISGKTSEIEIIPAKPGTGIVFVNPDTQEKIPAKTSHVLGTLHSVTIGNASFNIKLVEHLMAALALTKTIDVEVLVYGDEIPIGDGSSKPFYDLLKPVHPKPATGKRVDLPNSLYFNHGHTSIVAIPAQSFKITYAVNFVNSAFANSWFEWDSKTDSIEDIISARTFGYTRDLSVFQSQGLALGVNVNNTVGLNDDGTITTKLRYPNEPVRHKILDLIGDIYLTGLNPLDLNIHIIAIECGHFQHIELARLLENALLVNNKEEK